MSISLFIINQKFLNQCILISRIIKIAFLLELNAFDFPNTFCTLLEVQNIIQWKHKLIVIVAVPTKKLFIFTFKFNHISIKTITIFYCQEILIQWKKWFLFQTHKKSNHEKKKRLKSLIKFHFRYLSSTFTTHVNSTVMVGLVMNAHNENIPSFPCKKCILRT